MAVKYEAEGLLIGLVYLRVFNQYQYRPIINKSLYLKWWLVIPIPMPQPSIRQYPNILNSWCILHFWYKSEKFVEKFLWLMSTQSHECHNCSGNKWRGVLEFWTRPRAYHANELSRRNGWRIFATPIHIDFERLHLDYIFNLIIRNKRAIQRQHTFDKSLLIGNSARFIIQTCLGWIVHFQYELYY